ncbi:polyamine ABC transporter substrate-binding protein [Marinomonas atlantica]|uniref:polyamine ABC transporter substrate-binding protein n=1 Tax=Marinomonas atlantica TaxID=1806668 RepID=UPI0008325DE7|nr:spermidine/putrescine ABC transporter substrate-binding protein [Marinomonas atlantica]MCO4785513.1 spermidine/putrescine ABC transporter substrate-binding protein [Marinomonas atlantica]
MFHNFMVCSAIIFGASSVPSVHAENAPLTFFTWEDFVDETVIEEWEAQTGIPIHLVLYDDEGERNLGLSGHNASNIDVVVIDNATINILSQAGHLFPVSQEQDREKFWPQACGNYGRHYLWGTYGIVYRNDKVDVPITSWMQLMDPVPELSGHIGMLGQADELLTSSLAALGFPIDTEDESHLKEAFKLLKKQSPHVATYDYIYTFISTFPENEDIWLAPAYSGDQDGLNEKQGVDYWQYVIPDQGAVVWVDCLAISMKSKRKEEAQAFIDYLSRKEISARNAERFWTASPYKDSIPFIDKEVLNDKSIYLDSDVLLMSTLYKELKGMDILRRTRIKDALIRYYDSN